MSKSLQFKWLHYQPDIILCCVRWYLSYPLSYRQVEELITERGLPVDHSTVFRWVQHYSPELDKCCRRYLRLTNDSWRVDETYIKVKGQWKYLYRAVDSAGNTLDFLLTTKRDAKAAKRFFRKTLKAAHNQQPRVVTVDQNPAYPKAIADLKAEQVLPQGVELRPCRYLNNIVEQDHRFIKRLVKLGMGFGSFNTARRTLRGYETMHMLRKGQIQGVAKGAVTDRVKFIAEIFGVAA